jgi:nucleotide-binding universal stress UspA family protein
MRNEMDNSRGLADAFKRVMIAVDDSATSRWALEVGGTLAARLGATVGLLHVVDLAKGFAPELAVLDERVLSEMRVAGADLLKKSEQSLPA